MPHGLPDFGASTPKETIFGQVDIAELAARLGSIATYDRRGDVVWMDSFEAALVKWEASPFGVGASVAVDNTTARSGAQSVKLQAGNAVDDYALVQRAFPILVFSKIGAEISFTVGAADHEFEVRFVLYTGSERWYFYVRYVRSSNALQVWDAVGGWVTIATKKLIESSYCYHQLKLVVDFIIKDYVRLLVDDSAYDISPYAGVSAVNATSPSVYIILRHNNKVAFLNTYTYIDDFILTQNEP